MADAVTNTGHIIRDSNYVANPHLFLDGIIANMACKCSILSV